MTSLAVAPPDRARRVRVWIAVHTWTSLICTLFLLMLCITGLPLVFKDEIDDLIYDEVVAQPMDPATPHVSLDKLVDTAKAKAPGEFIQFFFWHPDSPGTVTFGLSPNNRADGATGLHAMTFDARSGEVIAQPKPRRGITFYLLKIHTDMFLNLPGKLFLGAMALVFIAALVSGAVIYGPFMRKLDFGEIRTGRTRRVRWLDLHNLLGIVTITWALVVGATGAMNTLAAPLFDLWRAQELPRLFALGQGRPLPEKLASVEDAVLLARKMSPDMRLVSVVYPYSRFSSPRHYLVWTKGTTPVTEHLFAPVLIDAETGELTGVLTLPWYLKLLELSRPLHFGNYGALPLKILWALLDLITIIVLLSGLYLWWRKFFRAPPHERAAIRGLA